MRQLDFAQGQWEQTWPAAGEYLAQQIQSSKDNTTIAQNAQKFYQDTYQPVESQFASEAANYNSPGRADQRAGAAMADVASSFDANRAASLANLESYGIDPSQTRYGALDLGTRISQAAATSAAGTQSRLNSEGTGLALQGEAINTGRGYAANVAGAYGTATNAGLAGINAANSTTQTAVNAMGTPSSYFNSGNNARSTSVNAMNTGYQNQMAASQFNAQQSNSLWSGVGSLVGSLAMAAAIA